jgi:hypothetical protein
MKRQIFIITLLVFTIVLAVAQNDTYHVFHPHHALDLIISHTEVSQGSI